MDEGKRKALLKEFDRFAGGRSLTAIYECEDLSDKEQAIMLYFGHCAEFQKNGFVELKVHRLETIAKKVRVSIDTARRTLHKLIDRGYISRVRRIAANNLELTPEYSMTWKIFDEYEEKWLTKQVEKKKLNDFGDSSMQAPPSSMQAPPSSMQAPPSSMLPLIIDPSSSCPSSEIDPPSSLGGCNGNTHPANVDDDVVEVVTKVEQLFSNPRNGYVPFKSLNRTFAALKKEHGMDGAVRFADYLKLIHEENRPKTWLGVGSKRPEEYRLSTNSMPKYIQWWQESHH